MRPRRGLARLRLGGRHGGCRARWIGHARGGVVHAGRGARLGRVPGRLLRPDPRGLRARSAPVRDLVRRTLGPRCSSASAPTSKRSAATSRRCGRARATIARRLCTIACFYRYAEQEGLIEHSPAVHVRRPRLDYESHATGLDRNEVGAMLVAAGLGGARDHALICAARPQRAARLRSDRRRHRAPRPRARPPHPHRPAQGRQDRHDPARATHRPRDRSGRR